MASVHVENIAAETPEKEVRDFFSFCGKIQSLSVTPTAQGTQSATVTFEKDTAAKTALLLDNTQLGPAQVKVTSSKSFEDLAGDKVTSEEATKDENLSQEDKPRGRIIAEYLAHGYVISDNAIERALALDKQHGVSNRFTTALKSFDEKYKATEKAYAVDEKYALSQKAGAGWRSLNSYFDKALGTPTGQKLRQFYETGNKQVVDVHNEARHLADLKKQNQGAAGQSKTPTAEEAEMEVIPGTDKTKCNCKSATAACPCEPGKCACSGCGKSSETPASSEKPAASS